MNKTTLSKFVIFTAGAAIGSVVTWKLIETKYQRIADEEIASVKEVFSKKAVEDEETGEDSESDDDQDEEPVITHVPEKPNLKEYASKISKEGYKDYSTSKNEKKEVPDMVKDLDAPFVISPEEFGEEPDYEQETLIYWADKVLTDDMNYIIDNVEDTVGTDSLTHFGEYEDDSVFVRNRGLNTDYEILLDNRKYADIPNKPGTPSEG